MQGFLFFKLAYNSKSNNNKPITTMKHITFITLLLSLAFTGCQKQQAADIDLDAVTTALEKSDSILGLYIEKLDSEFTTQDVKVKIVCRDYPHEYETNYAPNMLKLNSNYTESALLTDLDLVMDHYKRRDSIRC